MVIAQADIVALALDHRFDAPAHRRVLMHSPHTFDAFTYELWVPLLRGGTAVLADGSDLDLVTLAHTIVGERIRAVFLTARLFDALITHAPMCLAQVEEVWTGGEQVWADTVSRVLACCPGTAVVDAYGPTEITMFATCHRLSATEPVPQTIPIGSPRDGVRTYVLDAALRPVAAGVSGELYIAGAGVARGYLNRAAMTGARFVACPFGAPGERMYRTGDVVRCAVGGLLEYQGRADDQVKVNGVRIEPAEVEAVLAGLPGVGQCAVVARHDELSNSTRLVGYLVSTGGEPLDTDALRGQLTATMPAYMVPAKLTQVEMIPLTPHGKTDRSALGQRHTDPPRRQATALPRNGLEHDIAGIWSQVLGLERIDVHDNLFDIGGNSLHAARLTAEVMRQQGISPTLNGHLMRTLLAAPTIGAFAEEVGSILRQHETDVSPDRRREVPDFPAEAELEPDIEFVARSMMPAHGPRVAVLTGATGFFGIHLLHELLVGTSAKIICPVRAKDDNDAHQRIMKTARDWGISAIDESRIVGMAADLGLPRLGLSADHYRTLTEADVIYHNGAHVNFLYPYRALRQVNVEGTREIIRLSAAGGATPVHYVSTQAVFSALGVLGVRKVAEHTVPTSPDQLFMGYPETKWVAEELLRAAATRGMPLSIYRPHDLAGHTATGIWSPNTFLRGLLQSFVDMGAVPDVRLPLDFIPVDLAAKSLVRLSLHQPAIGTAWHLNNPKYALLGEFVEQLNEAGHMVSAIPMHDWVHALIAHSASHPESTIAPFLPLFTERWTRHDITVVEFYLEDRMPILGCARTWERVRQSGGPTEIPATADLLPAYISHLNHHKAPSPATEALL